MKFILGKKIEMTQKFKEDGTVAPVTAVLAGPCVVTQIKTVEKDGYGAIQIGFDLAKKLSKSQIGHLAKIPNTKYQILNAKYLREFRCDQELEKKYNLGDELTVDVFQIGDLVKVSGNSKGRGFQGVVKRHGFAGHPPTHGHKDQMRMPGSIGATDPGRVFPGTRMGGHMGDQNVTVKNLEIIDIDKDKNILFIKGAIPGGRNGLVEIVCE